MTSVFGGKGVSIRKQTCHTKKNRSLEWKIPDKGGGGSENTEKTQTPFMNAPLVHRTQFIS